MSAKSTAQLMFLFCIVCWQLNLTGGRPVSFSHAIQIRKKSIAVWPAGLNETRYQCCNAIVADGPFFAPRIHSAARSSHVKGEQQTRSDIWCL